VHAAYAGCQVYLNIQLWNEISNDSNTATEAVPNAIVNILNSLMNGIKRDSQDNYQEMITAISHRRISLPKDFTWRSRGLPGALQYQATEQDV